MLTIDQIGMIAYTLTVVNIVSLFAFFTKLFSFSFKNKLLNWLLLLIYALLGVYGAQMMTGLWNRYRMYLGIASGSDVSFAWAWEQFLIAVLFTGISLVLWTNNTHRFIDLSWGRKKK